MTDFAPDAVVSFFGQSRRHADVASRPQTNGVCERAEGQTSDCGSRSDASSEIFPVAPPALWQIFDCVCAHYDVSLANLRSACRIAKFVRPRHVAMYLARELTTRSFPQIGKALGDRDHTSVLHGSRRIEALMESDAQLAHEVASIAHHIRCSRARLHAAGNDNASALTSPVDLRPRATRPRHGFWTEHRIKKLREMWADGATDQQCASHFGVARSTIRIAVSRNNITRDWP